MILTMLPSFRRLLLSVATMPLWSIRCARFSTGCQLQLQERATRDDSYFEGGDSPAVVCYWDHSAERAGCFLVEVETETEKVLGSFRSREYDALRLADIPNGSRLNHIFKQNGGFGLSLSRAWLRGFAVGQQEKEGRGGEKSGH
jgi:hypothetical protein